MARSVFGKGLYVTPSTDDHTTLVGNDYVADGTKTGLLFAHGRGGLSQTILLPFFHPIAKRYPIFSGGFAGYSWGNDFAINAVNYGRDYLQGAPSTTGPDRPNAADGGIFLMGGSMGTMTVLNWARQLPDPAASIKAIALTVPQPDAEYIRSTNYHGYQAEIEFMYTNNAGWQAARPTHNPREYAAAFGALGIPIKAWTSSDDDTYLEATQAQFLDDLNAERVNVGAVGHSTGPLTGDEVADFFAEHE